jgi:hypothetical protein
MILMIVNIILLDLTTEKDDTCISIDVMNGEDTGRIYAIRHSCDN